VREKYDVVVIGGGLLGCFAARSLARYVLNVALLEKREDICTGISRANTAIIYSGCDTKPGTMKSSMCVSAAQSYPQLCDELGVRYSRCGSIMVCFGERGEKGLLKKIDWGERNGVRGMKLLTRDELLDMEPNIDISARSGLFVPDTGTVMPWELCIAAAENAASNGVELCLGTEVLSIQKITDAYNTGYEIITDKGTLHAHAIINCAGMNADAISEMISEPNVRIVPTAGDYFVLDTKAAGHIKHIIFHEPEEKGKGLTLVPTVDGNILVGPTERPGDDYSTELSGFNELRELIAQVIPSLPIEHIIRSFGAVRPNPYLLKKADDGSYVTDDISVNDFCILESDDGTVVSFVGVKTPGLTCADELGRYAADKIAAVLRSAMKTSFNPKREAPHRLADMAFSERSDFTRREDDSYSKIICRCRGISEGEILDAIHMCLGAVSIDGIKRRTGAGSGRCQGGFCGQSVREILAQELGDSATYHAR